MPDYIPASQRTGLLATFNGGFKLNSAGGGFYLNGIYHGALVNGAASVVYYKNGTVKIGEWGRDFTMNSSIAGVRQNLKLLVDHGQVSASANSDVTTNWGATLGGGYYVWRSGIGITKDGRVVYVYGSALNAQDLGLLLQRAGAVEGMQMDINPAWMKFDYYQAKGNPSDPIPVPLLPTQQPSPTRTTPRPPATSPRSTRGDAQQDGGSWRGHGARGRGARFRSPPRLAGAVAACRHRDDAAAAVAEEPAGVRGAAGRGLARPPLRLRAGRHVRVRLRVRRGLLRQRRRGRRAGPAAPGEAEPADRLRCAARAARGRARRPRGAVRGRRGHGDPRAAARRHGVGVPVHVVLYSFKLKHVPFIEMLIVASGFLLRLLGGAAATHVKPSVWFLLVCSLGALGVAVAKRYTELTSLGADAVKHRPVMRWYRPAMLRITQVAMGRRARDLPDVGARRDTATRPWHLASALPLTAALTRFGVLAARRTVRPVEDLITRDTVMLCCEAAWLALFCIGLYVE